MTPLPFLDQTRLDAEKVAAANPLEIEVAEKLPFHADLIAPVIQHGVSCLKVPHVGDGYLHAADDDRPYDVDGLLYCGRCHGWTK